MNLDNSVAGSANNWPRTVWLPVWDVASEELATYWLTPVCSHGNQSGPGYDASWTASKIHDDADFLALDIANGARVVEEAGRCLAAGLHCHVNLSVHATTLQYRERRQAFLASLSDVPGFVQAHLVSRIAEIEPGTPAATIAEWVRALRQISSKVALQLHESEPALELVSLTGAYAASFTLPPGQHQDVTKEHYAHHIQRWAAKLRRQHVLFRLDNVNDAGLLAIALASGVDLLTSERCWPSVAGPSGVKRFPRSRLGQIS